MNSLWPWIAVAALGALHGLNPASGWIGAAACGVRSQDGGQALRALWPLAAGHLASVVLVAGTLALGLNLPRGLLQWLAGGVLVVLVVLHCARHTPPRTAPATDTGLALWSFIASTSHGAGLMLVPALTPLCLSEGPAREITASGSLPLGLAAIGVHMAAMLAVSGVLASGACWVVDAVAKSCAFRMNGGVIDRLGHTARIDPALPITSHCASPAQPSCSASATMMPSGPRM